jgi:hypothetical protein
VAAISQNRRCRFARDKANHAIKNYSRSKASTGSKGAPLVGASALDVAGLLAAVANTLSGCLLGAVPGKMADLATCILVSLLTAWLHHGPLTVVALLALGAVTAHVTKASAGVACGLASSTISTLAFTSTATTAEASTATAVASSAVGAASALRAVAGNVTPLATLVALLATAWGATHAGTALLGALAADVAGTTATVAGLLSLGVLALAAHVALLAAVVASWGSLGGTLGSAVRRIST